MTNGVRVGGMVLLSLLCSTGCSPVKLQNINQYRIEAVSSKQLTTRPSNATLMVSTMKAASGYDDKTMMYVAKPYQLEAFSKNEWVAPPAAMLNIALVESLQNSGYFRAVVMPPYSEYTRYRLNATLLELKQSFLKVPSEVTLILKVELLDLTKGAVLSSRRFVIKRKTSADTPYGGVIATNEATKAMMEKIAQFVVKVIRRH